MIKNFGFNDTVVEDARQEVNFQNKSLGRSFVACCIEQGRFQLGPGLQPSRAVELVLGHKPLSSPNVNYLKLDVRPTPQVRISQQNSFFLSNKSRKSRKSHEYPVRSSRKEDL